MIPRAEFRLRLAAASYDGGKTAPWRVETGLKTAADWQPGEAAAPAPAARTTRYG